MLLSAFDSEELFRRALSFERFVQRFMDIEESFEDYIVREIKDNEVYDIFRTIRANAKPDTMLSMIRDLKDSEHREAAELLELPPDDPFTSLFLTVQILNSFFHTLCNINKGLNSMELS